MRQAGSAPGGGGARAQSHPPRAAGAAPGRSARVAATAAPHFRLPPGARRWRHGAPPPPARDAGTRGQPRPAAERASWAPFGQLRRPCLHKLVRGTLGGLQRPRGRAAVGGHRGWASRQGRPSLAPQARRGASPWPWCPRDRPGSPSDPAPGRTPESEVADRWVVREGVQTALGRARAPLRARPPLQGSRGAGAGRWCRDAGAGFTLGSGRPRRAA